jgi:hypothetical protein
VELHGVAYGASVTDELVQAVIAALRAWPTNRSFLVEVETGQAVGTCAAVQTVFAPRQAFDAAILLH